MLFVQPCSVQTSATWLRYGISINCFELSRFFGSSCLKFRNYVILVEGNTAAILIEGGHVCTSYLLHVLLAYVCRI